MKITAGLLISIISMIFCFSACSKAKQERFAFDAPIKKIVFDLPFPGDLLYQATPDEGIIIGKKLIEPAIYKITGYETSSGKELWQLSFTGNIVGQAGKQILVYEEKSCTLHFIDPKNGQIIRDVSPAPNPLASRNSLETGMAFTDEVYLTTKALYTTVYANACDWQNRQTDESFQIGITAKNYSGNEIKWFVPPVKQIVTIETRPLISGDKILIINPPQSAGGDQTYQIISLKTGAETFRGQSAGLFYNIGKNFFIERTDSFARRLDPFTGKELWKIEGDFHNASVSAIGDQLTFHSPDGKQTATTRIVEAETGKIFKQFELPYMSETSLKGGFVRPDGVLLLNLDSAIYDIYDKEHYNYWVGYDAEAKKALWRTDFNSHSASSLFPLASDKIRFE